MVQHVIEEEGAGHPLADRSPLQIGKRHDHGVHVTRLNLMGKGFQGQHASTLTQPRPAVQRYSGVTYAAVIPPSTTSADPVMNEDSSEARNRAARAISSGRPNRPMGMCTSRR